MNNKLLASKRYPDAFRDTKSSANNNGYDQKKAEYLIRVNFLFSKPNPG